MADIDKISVNNTTYNIKDSTARDSISRWKMTNNVSSVLLNVSTTSDNWWIDITTTDNRVLRIVFKTTGEISLVKNETQYAANGA